MTEKYTPLIIVGALIGLVVWALTREKAEAAPRTGSQSEVQDLIDAGIIPPPPTDVMLIPESEWFWTGSNWRARTRPGFEPITLI